ncbi:MAG: CPBP family intramembrane glutamic endopeptidase [archaeon]
MFSRKLFISLLLIFAPLSVILTLLIFKNAFITFLVYQLFICLVIPIIDLIIISKNNFRESLIVIGIKKENSKHSISNGLFFGIIFFLIIIASYYVFKDKFLDINRINLVLASFGITTASFTFILMISFIVIFNSILEEVFWRGYLYYNLLTKLQLSKINIILLTSFFFTSYHVFTIISFLGFNIVSTFAIICLFLISLFWGYLRFKFDNLISTIIIHFFCSLGYILILFLMKL